MHISLRLLNDHISLSTIPSVKASLGLCELVSAKILEYFMQVVHMVDGSRVKGQDAMEGTDYLLKNAVVLRVYYMGKVAI